MKRIIYIPAVAGVLAFGGIVLANTNSDDGLAPVSDNATQVEEKVQASSDSSEQKDLIGFERASSIALELAEGDVTDIELSEDDGRREYDVDIRSGEYKYEFEIDAFTGEVLEQDRDRIGNNSSTAPDDRDDRKQDMSDDSGDTNESAEVQVSKAQASDIALREAGGGKVEEIELDSDDGLQYYEVEIVNDNVEFELAISASDGSVLKFEQDDNNDGDDDEGGDDEKEDDDNDDD